MTIAQPDPGKMMTDSKEKVERELRVFKEFMQRSSLPIESDSVIKCDPPWPDISCNIDREGIAHFELVEICDESVAEVISKQSRVDHPEPEYVRPGDPVPRICKQKRSKKYKTQGPIDIVFYTAGRIALPADVLIPKIRREFFDKPDPFRRVWLMAEPGQYCGCIIGG